MRYEIGDQRPCLFPRDVVMSHHSDKQTLYFMAVESWDLSIQFRVVKFDVRCVEMVRSDVQFVKSWY